LPSHARAFFIVSQFLMPKIVTVLVFATSALPFGSACPLPVPLYRAARDRKAADTTVDKAREAAPEPRS
jgi:hypothetical protein